MGSMSETRMKLPIGGQHGLLLALITGYAVWAGVSDRLALGDSLGLWLVLGVGGVVGGLVHRLDGSGRSPRFALTFVLTAFALLPSPAGIAVALAAALTTRGGGVAGTYRSGAVTLAPLLGAVALAQLLAGFWFQTPKTHIALLLGLTVAFLVAQLAAFGLGSLLHLQPGEATLSGPMLRWRPPVLELLNVPLAWLLTSAIARDAWLQAAGVAGLTVFLGWNLMRLGRALHDLRRTNDALALRLSELGTLHAISREILSTLEPDQVFAIIERECEKLLSVDGCTIALRDRDTSALATVFQRCRGESIEKTRSGALLTSGLAVRVAATKRAVSIDDCCLLAPDSLYRGLPLSPRARSAAAVPLIVEEQVTGVIVLESSVVAAYDAHQLSVLTTIAQQAAVAIENARNYQLATVDSLTGFSSRDYFFRRLEEEHTRVGRYGGQFALLMLDLDGFKDINDRHGHQAGDLYLRGIAETVREQLREADLPCRYGGDEFCVLLPETELKGAQVIAERIRVAVASRAIGTEAESLSTTISVGVAAFPDHDSGELKGLLRNADEALYRAKRAGRNCVVPFAA